MNESLLVDKSVLVAEDNSINQMVVKHTLLKLGAKADIAGDGAEAIEKLKNKPYDLVLMDIQMPLMDGYETTSYIRNQLNSNVPIIAMTAFALNGERERCLEAGMNGYVSKPFTIESLNGIIETIIAVPNETNNNNNPYVLGDKDVAVDVSMLYDISGDDESYIQTMVHTFLENMPGTIKRIEQSFIDKDWENLYKAAHYAKSSLSIIKINEMYDRVVAIEGIAKNKTDFSALPELVEKTKEKFSQAQQVLTRKFGPGVIVTNY